MPIRNEVKVMKVVQANMTCSILCSSHGSAFMSIFVSISDSSVLRYKRDINNIFIEFIDECLNLSLSHTNKEGKPWLWACTIMIPSLKATRMHHKIHFTIMFVLWLKLFLNCERWETQDARSGHAHIMVYMVKQPTNHLGWLIPFI